MWLIMVHWNQLALELITHISSQLFLQGCVGSLKLTMVRVFTTTGIGKLQIMVSVGSLLLNIKKSSLRHMWGKVSLDPFYKWENWVSVKGSNCHLLAVWHWTRVRSDLLFLQALQGSRKPLLSRKWWLRKDKGLYWLRSKRAPNCA